MKNTVLAILLALGSGSAALAGTEGMPRMPLAGPGKIYTVPSQKAGEELLEQRGFGEQEPQVKMMNLMMVEGSGMEGMEMAPKKIAAQATPSAKSHGQFKRYLLEILPRNSQPKVGVNILEFTIKDAKDAKPALNLVIQAEVSMADMNMGTETPKVEETAPGKYQLNAAFTMQGAWNVKLVLPGGQEENHTFNAKGK